MPGDASGSLAGQCRLGQMLRQFIIEKPTVPAMSLIRALAVLPFLGILAGTPFLNRVTPLVFGLPFLLAWLLLWIVLTSGIMLVDLLCDPANRAQPPAPGSRAPSNHSRNQSRDHVPGVHVPASSRVNGSRDNGSGAREAHP